MLVKLRYISIDPYLRLRLKGNHQSGSIAAGEVITSSAIVELQEDSATHKSGTLLVGIVPWQEYSSLDQKTLDSFSPLPPSLDRPSLCLGILGMPGFTAWVGTRVLLSLDKLQDNDTVVISAASGVVGSMACQFVRASSKAANKTVKIIGIAGSDQKCEWLTETLGCDHAIQYKKDDISKALKTHAPKGAAIYFDNVGGSVLNAVLDNLAPFAQVLLCGLAQQYNASKPIPLNNVGMLIASRATMRGMVIYDHYAHYPEFQAEAHALYQDNQLIYRETILPGIQATIPAMLTQFAGENFGKVIIEC